MTSDSRSDLYNDPANFQQGHKVKHGRPKAPPGDAKCVTEIRGRENTEVGGGVHSGALSKSDTSPEIFQSKFLEVCEGLQDHYHLYTDGSRMNSLVGAAAVGRDVSKILRITDKASIFTAELVVLNLALYIIRRSTRKKFVIFSDSLRKSQCLMAIHNNCHLETGYVQKFISDYSQLVNSGKPSLCVGFQVMLVIRGNERADVAAKSALSSTISAVKCSPTDLYQSLTNHCQRLWHVSQASLH